MPITDARNNFAEVVNRVHYTGEPVALTRRGRVMAGLVSAEDLELLRLLRAGLLDLIQTAPQPGQAADRPDPSRAAEPPAAPGPLRIAAQYRPGGPAHPPGFSR